MLGVSPSGFYDWRDRPPCRRKQFDKRLLKSIYRVHQQSRENDGALKTWKALNQQGIRCGKHRVARLRSEHNILSRRRRRFVVTTHSKRHSWAASNKLARQFVVDEPNRIWVGDVTFVPTQSGWLYLAVIIDLYSRKVVGWSMSGKNDQQLVLDALNMAIEVRSPEPGLMHHTDRGSSYTAASYQRLLAKHCMISSMSRTKDCWDNAVAESFFNNLKNECTHDQRFATKEQARSAVFDYIEIFYNRQRLHQTLGYQSPEQFEQANVA